MGIDLTQPPALMESGGQPIIPAPGSQTLTPSEAAPQAPSAQNMPINTRPAPAQAQVQPTVKPQSTFHRALQALAGGPTQIQDPNTGEVKEVPETKGSLSRHILAGAISGMMQGWEAGAKAPQGPLGSSGPAVAAAAGAGFQGSQDKLKQIRQAPQQQMDEQEARKYNTMKRNIDLHGAMLTAGNASRQAQDAIDAPGQALIQAADDFSAGDTSGVPLIAARGLSYDEIMKQYPNMSQNNFIPMGHRDIMNPDGTPKLDPKTGIPMREPLFAVVNPEAKISLTPDLKAQFGKMQPGLDKLADNTPINLKAFLSMQTQHINVVTGADALKAASTQLQSVGGSKQDQDFQKVIQSDPVLRKNAAAIGQYLGHGNNVMDGISAMVKATSEGKLDPQIVGRLSAALGLNNVDKDGKTFGEKLQLKLDKEKEMQKDDEELRKRRQDAQVQRELAKNEKIDAADIKNRATEPYTSNTQHFSNEWTDSDGFNYDLSHPAMKLVDGTLAPQELSKRATKGSDSYNSIIKAADDYSMKRYGKSFDFQQADNDYKYASQTGTQNTLKFLNSLTGHDNKSGNIGKLVQVSDTINRTDFPAINNAEAWARLQSGDPSLAAYYTTVTEVADQVAKILQGGGSGSGTSDAKLKQAQEMFNTGFSKESLKTVASTLRDLLGNRKTEMIGDNRYLQKQYGLAGNIAPSSNFSKITKDGKLGWNGKAWVSTGK
jgi:hypothetical protein